MASYRASAILVIALSAFLTGCVSEVTPDYEGFIRVQNQRFVDANCRDFPVTGMNT